MTDDSGQDCGTTAILTKRVDAESSPAYIMASYTYSEYPQSTMASSSADFTLYPAYDWSQDQTYMPTTTFEDQTYFQATTFDSSFAAPAYSHPQLEQFHFNGIQYPQKQITQQPRSPHQSPAHSVTQSLDHQQAYLSSVSDSGASAPSTISSAMASPSVVPQAHGEWSHQQSLAYYPSIVQHDETYTTTGVDFETIPVLDVKGCVDPSLIQPFSPPQYPDVQTSHSPHTLTFPPHPSPAPSVRSARSARSPHTKHWQPYPQYSGSRRHSISSVHSKHSQGSVNSDDSNKGLCPIPSCGKQFKDLKAHMLTHQETRPEKCPIPTCEYSIKGFARKYDKNRHTLTHYKGTMVCGFCPGSGSAVEKSFNRADVFKRHLTSVHGVEQTPPNARRKSPPTSTKRLSHGLRDASGMCSTCNNIFASPQDFYEHLDDCVLRVVQQADPSEAINERLLKSIADDSDVRDTMDRHSLPNNANFHGPTSFNDDDDEQEDEDEEDFGRKKAGVKGRKAGNSS